MSISGPGKCFVDGIANEVTDNPRITFGIIVLNGHPFTRDRLALYPFAHQIIVVEGATKNAAAIAGSDGHSTDGTLETLRDFKVREDPQDKLIIVTAEDEGHPNGFWPGEKDEQSRAYARRATGDYLWQVDVDEFYKSRDMQAVLDMLRDRPDITAVSFKQIAFWGGFEYVTDGWYLRRARTSFTGCSSGGRAIAISRIALPPSTVLTIATSAHFAGCGRASCTGRASCCTTIRCCFRNR